MRSISCIVDQSHNGQPVYRVLREQLRVSDACVRRAKHVEGGITLDGRPVWTNAVATRGQCVGIVIDAPGLAGSSSDIVPQDGPLRVVYADDDMMVVDKQAGLPMYPGPGHADATLANHVSGWLRRQGRCSGIHAAHRLDAGTTGLVVFAFNSFSKERLQEQLHTRAFEREYLALCEGHPEPDSGYVRVPLGLLSRHPNTYGVTPDGKPAVTQYRVLRAFDSAPARYSLVRLRLGTGRTHQIRIHMAYIGHPLLGDAVYGRACQHIGRPALHSHRIALDHPVTGERLSFTARLPQDMGVLCACPAVRDARYADFDAIGQLASHNSVTN